MSAYQFSMTFYDNYITTNFPDIYPLYYYLVTIDIICKLIRSFTFSILNLIMSKNVY